MTSIEKVDCAIGIVANISSTSTQVQQCYTRETMWVYTVHDRSWSIVRSQSKTRAPLRLEIDQKILLVPCPSWPFIEWGQFLLKCSPTMLQHYSHPNFLRLIGNGQILSGAMQSIVSWPIIQGLLLGQRVSLNQWPPLWFSF